MSIYVVRIICTIGNYSDIILINYKFIGGFNMARIPRLMSLNNQLNKITDEITNMKESLKRLDATKKELENQIKQAELVELDNLISNRGLTFEEVKELLKK